MPLPPVFTPPATVHRFDATPPAMEERERSALSPDLGWELETALREIGIPPRPLILEKIAHEARSEYPDFNHMAGLIGRDVGLAASLIKTANSPFYGYRQKTRSIREALLMLGLNTTANTIAGLMLRRAFPPQMALQRFWDSADLTAQLSGWLVQQLGTRGGIRAEDAYTYGLFRDCGIPILMRRFADYPRLLARANENAVDAFTAVERAALPTQHAAVGGLMAQDWMLPETTYLAIRQHHDLAALTDAAALPGASRRLIALAQTAEKLIQDLTGRNHTCEWEKLGTACLACLQIEATDVTEMTEAARNFLAEVEPI